MKRVHVDFESQSEFDLRRGGAFEYSMHPTTRVLCMVFKFGKNPPFLLPFEKMQKPWGALNAKIKSWWVSAIENPAWVFVAHNAYFEQVLYNNILVRRLGWPAIPGHKWRCTAAKAAVMAIPRNLADAGAVMRLPIQKDFDGYHVMMKLCKPTRGWTAWKKANDEIKSGIRVGQKKRTIAEAKEPAKFWTPESAPGDFKTLYHYCKIDVLSEEQLDERLPDLNPFEQKLWFIDQKINLRGVKVDMPLVNRIAGIMEKESRTMIHELDILTMGLVSSGNARAAILDFLTIEGIQMPNLRAATVEDYLATGHLTGDSKRLLEIRRALAKSSTAKYQNFQRRAASDGRVRDLTMYHGASTGRWAGVGIQPQNFPRGIIKDSYEAIDRIKTCSVDELKLLYGENLMPLFSSVLRGMFIASSGATMHVQDWSAIECRVTFWLAGHEKGLQMFRDGRDPYKEMAVEIYNKQLLDITDDERQVGKAAVLGCGFQMGHRKFISSAWDIYRARVTLGIAKVAVKAYRKHHYPVVEMWANYNEAAIFAVENPAKKYRVGRVKFYMEKDFLKIELPSTRKLAYAYPKIEMGTVVKMKQKDGEDLYVSNAFDFKAALTSGAKKVDSFKSKRLTYMAVNHKARKIDCEIPKWTREKTYGGKLCIAEGTLVLTKNRGWVPIENILIGENVWDGIDWVRTDGVVCNGVKETISAYGVQMTADHLVLTTKGWVCASQSKGYNRFSCRVPYGFEIPRERRQEITLESPMRLQENPHNSGNGIAETKRPGGFGKLWLPSGGNRRAKQSNPWHEFPSSLCGLALNERPLSIAYAPSLAQLWCAGDSGLQAVAKMFSKLLARHGAKIPPRFDDRPDRQQSRLFPGQLPLDDLQGSSQQSTAKVYDLLNCGPRNRFVIEAGGKPLIVHNCENIVQAVARDLLAESIVRAEEMNFSVLMHSHDELVAEDLGINNLKIIMETMPKWAEGLPLRAAGWIGNRYAKM